MYNRPLLLALAISCAPMATYATDWSKEPLVAAQQATWQGNVSAQILSLAVPGKTLELSKGEWSKMGDETNFAKNFEEKKEAPWHKFGRVVTVYLNPMSEDRRSGLKISKTEYVELFSVHPGFITAQVRVDKGGYWVLCRETFKPKAPMPAVTLRSYLSENEELQLLHHYQVEIDETRYLLNSKF